DDSDRLLGCVSECNVYVSHINSDLFADAQFTIDIAKGIGSAFSLEIPEGYRFKLVSNSCHFK
ncbi:MAG TPA: DUF779 domain-containing protein, partial [Saprospiraceae bacterium]|nr:DUF779 domain-containing protein [Saprospiraceae bacterium]